MANNPALNPFANGGAPIGSPSQNTPPVSTQSPAQGYKISLTVGTDVVIFEASSPLDESRTAHYEGMNIMHLPTDIQSFKNTSARSFGITAKLVSRNAVEASINARYVDFIRSWVLPDFGGTGATPPIVKLSAFRNRNIREVPCVIKSYSIHYPDDVDWIFDGQDPMPVIGSISVTLEEAWSPAQITAGAWSIHISPGGRFMTGSDYNDNTSASSGDTTPPLIDLSNSSQFMGLASRGTRVGDTYVPTSPVGAGTNSCMNFGIDSSSSILDSNPPTNGYTPESANQLGLSNTSYLSNQTNNLLYPSADTYGRSTLSSNPPIKF